jgi:hypothetical protein
VERRRDSGDVEAERNGTGIKSSVRPRVNSVQVDRTVVQNPKFVRTGVVKRPRRRRREEKECR